MSKFTFGFYLDIRIPLKDGSYSIGVRLYDKKLKKVSTFQFHALVESHFVQSQKRNGKVFGKIKTSMIVMVI